MIARKRLMHFLDVSFGGEAPIWLRLGADLEEFNLEANPEVNVTKNIIGNQSVKVSGYEKSAEVGTYFACDSTESPEEAALFEKLKEFYYNEETGTALNTYTSDVFVTADGTVEWAKKTPVKVVVQSLGGNTEGVQAPFTIYNTGKSVDADATIEDGKLVVS